MAKFKALIRFADLTDNNRIYEVGEIFPRPGMVVSEDRLSELSTSRNKVGKPVIEEIPMREIKEARKDAETPLEAKEESAEPKKKRTYKKRTSSKKNAD